MVESKLWCSAIEYSSLDPQRSSSPTPDSTKDFPEIKAYVWECCPVWNETPSTLFCAGYPCQMFADEPWRDLMLFLLHVVSQQRNYVCEAKVAGRLSKSTVNVGGFLSKAEVYLCIWHFVNLSILVESGWRIKVTRIWHFIYLFPLSEKPIPRLKLLVQEKCLTFILIWWYLAWITGWDNKAGFVFVQWIWDWESQLAPTVTTLCSCLEMTILELEINGPNNHLCYKSQRENHWLALCLLVSASQKD